ncbi:ankyrin repeat-containing domain protein [Chaetomium fimeti]|uniref:Ankyrin repeat-containing domain protein n=1 Tax=Chaetomium fimeti TaxID=1854472 RepID=A0AAE0LNF4_9PEZI|nr:ankyrin repeat-containing domain protein [Chaetomium fimeti]
MAKKEELKTIRLKIWDLLQVYQVSPRRGLKTPAFLRGLLGSLFAAYTGAPEWRGAVVCDTAMCHRQSSRTWEIEYQFPLWFANWNIHALMHMASTGGPTLCVVVRERVEYRFDNIFRAVDSNNVDAIQAILQRNPDSVNYRLHRDGFTPFHYACLRPTKISFRVFQLLLRAGADLDAENDSGRSALSYVASHIVLGGFPDAHTQEISRWVSMSRIVHELELSPVAEVAVGLRVGDITQMLRALPPSELKLTDFDNTGSTPLCWASKAGNLKAIQAIVKIGGVDINQPTSTGNTPLMCSFALQNQVGELIDWLLDNGADPAQQNRDGYNAFTLACYIRSFDVVQKLIERGVDPDIRDGQGRTGLCTSVAYDHDHIARYLCKLGADVNAVNARGFVPLLVATGYNAHRCLRMLLFETEADHLFHAHDNWNLLLHAGSCGDVMTMNILADHGLRGLDVQAKSSNLTVEDTFFSRPAAASESMLVAFRNLIAVVERNTANMPLEEVVQAGEDTEEEVYFDTVCTL